MEGYVYGSKACDDNGERTIKDPWKVAGWILEVPDNKRNLVMLAVDAKRIHR